MESDLAVRRKREGNGSEWESDKMTFKNGPCRDENKTFTELRQLNATNILQRKIIDKGRKRWKPDI